MLEDLATYDEIRCDVLLFGRIELMDETDRRITGVGTLGHVTRVKPDASATRQRADRIQEFPFAATDFQNLFPCKSVFFNEVPGELLCIGLKERREVQGVLVLLGVFHQDRVERPVKDVTTLGAKDQVQVARWCRASCLAGFPLHVAVNGDAVKGKELDKSGPAADDALSLIQIVAPRLGTWSTLSNSLVSPALVSQEPISER